MRNDIAFDAFAYGGDPTRLAPLVRPENLAYARFETTLSFTNQGLLDLVFERDGAIAIVPWIVLEGVMLLEHEESPFVWPSWMGWLAPELTDAIEAQVEPWLRSRVTARLENHHGERFFDASSGARELIEFARSANWLGAASAVEVLRSIAPHRYAVRFAEGAATLVCGLAAANGGAYLARHAKSLVAVLRSDSEVRAATAWFGSAIFATEPAASPVDLYIGPRNVAPNAPVRILLDGQPSAGEVRIPVVEPLPPAIVLSYDLDDAPECDAFSVAAPATPGRRSALVEPVVQGGSGGRIAMLVREDCARGVDADSDAVNELSEMLRAEGFTPEIVTPSHFDGRGYDLVHVFGFRYAGSVIAALERTAMDGTPIVVTPYADDPANETASQTENVTTVAASSDETLRGEYLDALAQRVLRTEGATASYDPSAQKRLLQIARIAFVTCPREEALLRANYGFTGAAARVAAIPSLIGRVEDVTAYVGTGDFILLRGPVQAQANPYLIARAAASTGLPLVVSGEVMDALAYQQMSQALGVRGMWLPSHWLTQGQRAGLVSRARVAVDISWSSRGLHFLATAGAARCAIVASTNGYAADVWGDAVISADPASVNGIATALRLAWEEATVRGERLAARVAAQCDPYAMLVATATGYQAAASAPVAP